MELILWIALFLVCPPLAILLLGVKVFGKFLKLFLLAWFVAVVLTTIQFLIH